MRSFLALFLLLASASALAACGYEDPLDPSAACDSLRVEVGDRAVAPPANVSALVHVTDCRGNALGRRLDPSAFELAENGRVLSFYEADRMIIAAERQTAQRTLVALDLSGSILRAGLRPPMIEGVKRLIAALGSAQEIAVFGFDGRPDLIPFAYFTGDPVVLGAALERADGSPLVDESTNLNGAVVNALRVLDRAVEADARDIYSVAHGSLVIFTDGQDLAGRVSEDQLHGALDATPHSTFAVGLGASTDELSLAEISRTAHFHAADADGIDAAFSAVAAELSARAQANYVVSYCSPARAGSRTLEIIVHDGEAVGRAAIDFDATGFGAGCSPAGSPLK